QSDDNDYSTTNVQVKGVDEADIIKTDGEYIYFVVNRYYDNSTVAIVKANSGDMSKVWEYNSEDHTISEIFLSDNKLVLLMQPNSFYYRTFATDFAPVNSATRVEIYDLTDKANPTLVRSFEQEGSYNDARISNGKLLLVTCKYAYNYIYGITEFDAEAVIPRTMDSVVSEEMAILPPDACYIVPNTESLSFGTISTIDLTSDTPAQSVTIMGDINTIYANTENVYVTANRYEYAEKSESTSYGDYTYYTTLGSYTDITKIAYSGTLQVIATGTVSGNLCSQFAMDEYEGNLRVATNSWDYQKDNKQYNNFYVLNGQMLTIGTLEGLAEGENMYAVRFEGKKAYAVTYRQTDPFFVINLDDPTQPYVQGELKIPGFSQYLQPYAENLVIGFGMDAIEDVTGTNGLTMGFKVAMFDVSDPSNPKELTTFYIGDRGTYSDLSYDHKALLFDKEKNIIAFPISISKLRDGAEIYEYGTTVFTGYIVLGYDAQTGFYEKGRITHAASTDEISYRYDSNIVRGLYIDDVIYTLSNNILAANRLSDFTQISRIEFEIPQDNIIEPTEPSMPDYVSSTVSKVY
nr:beta-propeller domain-containing protein [Oscillospiraceae bacterium]